MEGDEGYRSDEWALVLAEDARNGVRWIERILLGESNEVLCAAIEDSRGAMRHKGLNGSQSGDNLRFYCQRCLSSMMGLALASSSAAVVVLHECDARLRSVHDYSRTDRGGT